MNNIFYIEAYAHEDTDHETAVEATTHYLDFVYSPYVAIPLFFLVIAAVVAILTKFKISFSKKVLITLILIFFSGIIGFIYVPPLGIVAITLGFALSIGFVLVGLKSGA